MYEGSSLPAAPMELTTFNCALHAGRQEVKLGLDVVDGVDHHVPVAPEELGRALLAVEIDHGPHVGLRVDLPAALGHQLGLGLAHRAGDGVELAVGVGDAHHVEVHQGQVAHAAAHQALDRVAADAAEPEDDDPRLSQTAHTLLTQQPPGSIEPPVELRRPGG